MKKNIIWLTLSCLMVLSLVLASCAPAATPTATSTPTLTGTPTPTLTGTPTPAKEVPTYGGTLTTMLTWAITSWGPHAGGLASSFMYEDLVYGDWYIPRDQWPFAAKFWPPKVLTGWLAESWEIPDSQTFVFHLRKGVRFWNKPPANGRELVASDVKWFYEDYKSNPRVGQSELGGIDSITTPDKYTIVFHTKEPRTPDFIGEFQAAYYRHIGISPPELGREGVQDWRNSLGTGPWILKDYVTGSAATYVRNPDYWQFDQNYPQNRLPYMDGVTMLLITDVSTQLAAIRTGKADLITEYFGTSLDQFQIKPLQTTTPQLVTKQYLGRPLKFAINSQKAPFTDVRVRQAMNMAIDQDTIIRDYYKGQALNGVDGYPFSKAFGNLAMQFGSLPKNIQEIYTYNPDKAKKLLADAGYPNGFKTSILCNQSQVDMVSMVREQLLKAGIDMQIQVGEVAAVSAAVGARDYSMYAYMTGGWGTPGDPREYLTIFWVTGQSSNMGNWSNEAYDNKMKLARQTIDEQERYKLYQEAALIALEGASYLIGPAPSVWGVKWPWLKGWNFETGMYFGDMNMIKHWWLDLNLKKSMTGR